MGTSAADTRTGNQTAAADVHRALSSELEFAFAIIATAKLLNRAGLQLTSVTPTTSAFSIIEAARS